jgi:hypothetical protein
LNFKRAFLACTHFRAPTANRRRRYYRRKVPESSELCG